MICFFNLLLYIYPVDYSFNLTLLAQEEIGGVFELDYFCKIVMYFVLPILYRLIIMVI